MVHTYRLHVAAVYVLASFLFVHLFHGLSYNSVIVVLCFSFLCVGGYLINRFFDRAADSVNEKHLAVISKNILHLGLLFITLPSLVFLFSGRPVLPYLFLALLTVLYSTSPRCLINIRIKDIWFLKNIYAAGVWFLSWVFIIAWYEEAASLYDAFHELLPNFFIVLFYEVLWDIRDIKGDMAFGTKTVATLFGETISKGVATCSLFLAFVSSDSVASLTLVPLLFLIPYTIFITSKSPNYLFHLAIYYQILCIIVAFIRG